MRVETLWFLHYRHPEVAIYPWQDSKIQEVTNSANKSPFTPAELCLPDWRECLTCLYLTESHEDEFLQRIWLHIYSFLI